MLLAFISFQKLLQYHLIGLVVSFLRNVRPKLQKLVFLLSQAFQHESHIFRPFITVPPVKLMARVAKSYTVLEIEAGVFSPTSPIVRNMKAPTVILCILPSTSLAGEVVSPENQLTEHGISLAKFHFKNLCLRDCRHSGHYSRSSPGFSPMR